MKRRQNYACLFWPNCDLHEGEPCNNEYAGHRGEAIERNCAIPDCWNKTTGSLCDECWVEFKR